MTMRTPLVLLDLVLAAALVAGVVSGIATVVTLAAGFDLVTVKHVLFVVGLLLFGVAALQWRSSVDLESGPGATSGSDAGPGTGRGFGSETTGSRSSASSPPNERTRLRALLEALLPEAWILPRSARVSDPAKLTLAGLLVLFVSYLMEAVFGIGV